MNRRHIILIVPLMLAGCLAIFDDDGPKSTRAAFPEAAASTAPATRPATQPATQPATAPDQSRREKIKLAREEFQLELAADPESRAKGLMGRTEIKPDGGMLFVYPRPAHVSFWMANCLIDIDIAFLDYQGHIISTYTMKAEPPRRHDETQADYEARLTRYLSVKSAQFAIELKAGTIERLKLKPGQLVRLDVKRLKEMAR